MKPRAKPLAPLSPLPARYWSMDLQGKGTHVFKHPYYGVGAGLLLLLRAHAREGEEDRSIQEQALGHLPVAGAVIGACWAHPRHELETQLSLKDLTVEGLEAYGHKVAEELQDAGYNLLEVLDLMNVVVPALAERQSLAAMAMDRAAFSAAPLGSSTVS